jgi:hypothetical protein
MSTGSTRLAAMSPPPDKPVRWRGVFLGQLSRNDGRGEVAECSARTWFVARAKLMQRLHLGPQQIHVELASRG